MGPRGASEQGAGPSGKIQGAELLGWVVLVVGACNGCVKSRGYCHCSPIPHCIWVWVSWTPAPRLDQHMSGLVHTERLLSFAGAGLELAA